MPDDGRRMENHQGCEEYAGDGVVRPILHGLVRAIVWLFHGVVMDWLQMKKSSSQNAILASTFVTRESP